MNPSRRSLLAAASAAAGLSLTALGGEHALALALDVTTSTDDQGTGGELLAPRALEDLGAIATQLIPRTDTPSALDVGAHRTVDRLLARCHGAPRQQQVVGLLSQLSTLAAQAPDSGSSFASLPAATQLTVLRQLDQGAPPFSAAQGEDWRFLKSLLVFAYCTSQPGATQLLAYDPLPGAFQGSVPYARLGKAWFK